MVHAVESEEDNSKDVKTRSEGHGKEPDGRVLRNGTDDELNHENHPHECKAPVEEIELRSACRKGGAETSRRDIEGEAGVFGVHLDQTSRPQLGGIAIYSE